MHLVDTVDVDADNLGEYLRVVEELGVPVMTHAGAGFVSCATTEAGLGEPVTVQVTWAFADHERWNEIRRDLVLDPRWHEYGHDSRRCASGARGGSCIPPPFRPRRPPPMLRRFELYASAPRRPGRVGERPRARRVSLRPPHPRGALLRGRADVADSPVDLVWEHAFDSPAAYRRYMAHPYHAAVLDRYLLADSPERIVADDALGAGLVGYALRRPRIRVAVGARRVVLLRVDQAAAAEDVERLWRTLRAAPSDVAGMAVSVVAPNTLGPAWFDGETPITGPPRWTHLWEQGFVSLDAMAAYRDGSSAAARVEREAWTGTTGGVIRRAAEVAYALALRPRRRTPERDLVDDPRAQARHGVVERAARGR